MGIVVITIRFFLIFKLLIIDLEFDTKLFFENLTNLELPVVPEVVNSNLFIELNLLFLKFVFEIN